MFRRAKATNHPDHWSRYHRIASEYCAATASAKNTFLNNTLPSFLVSNPRKFWSIVAGTKKNVLQLIQSDVPVPTHECCEILNNTFSSFFSDQYSQIFHSYRPQVFRLWILSRLTGLASANLSEIKNFFILWSRLH